MGCYVSTRRSGGTVCECASCLQIGKSRKKRIRKRSAGLIVSLQQLALIPNRIFANGKTRTSCICTQQGRKGVNQDAMIVWEDFISEDTVFCGVFDGHGPQGHLVARRVRDALPVRLLSFLETIALEDEKDSSVPENGESFWRDAFLKSYKAMDKQLRSQRNLNCISSGSTAITIVKQGLDLFIGNIGDSRAVMGSRDDNNSMVATQLTVDLKPDLPREAERIRHCKGRVFALQDEPEVCRVWLPYDDAPGLAMARAFGDFCLKDYGVISVPEFSHRILSETDEFVVLATDGVS